MSLGRAGRGGVSSGLMELFCRKMRECVVGEQEDGDDNVSEDGDDDDGESKEEKPDDRVQMKTRSKQCQRAPPTPRSRRASRILRIFQRQADSKHPTPFPPDRRSSLARNSWD